MLTIMVQKQGKDAACGRNDDTGVSSEIYHLDQRHLNVLTFPVPLNQFYA